MKLLAPILLAFALAAPLAAEVKLTTLPDRERAARRFGALRAAWLDPKARYRDLLEPDANLEPVPVSTLVNSVKNDDPN